MKRTLVVTAVNASASGSGEPVREGLTAHTHNKAKGKVVQIAPDEIFPRFPGDLEEL